MTKNNETQNLKDVKDQFTGDVWKADRSHNAKSFNNHEVVRLVAYVMSKAQEKHGVNATTASAKAYVCKLVNDDLDMSLNAYDFTAPNNAEQASYTPEYANAQKRKESESESVELPERLHKAYKTLMDGVNAGKLTADNYADVFKKLKSQYNYSSDDVAKLKKAVPLSEQSEKPELELF